MSTPYENRRQYKRISVRIPASISLKHSATRKFEGEVLDISLGGAFIHCTAPILIGEEVLVEIHFENAAVFEAKVIDYEEWLKLNLPHSPPERSIVKWARGTNQSGFGVEFVSLHEDKKNFLNRLVDYYDQLQKTGVTFGT